MKDLLKNEGLRNFVLNIVGDRGMKLVDFLIKHGVTDEFTIAEKLDEQVNVVRSLLYELYSHKIVSYTKERDEKKGWWIYSWSIDPLKIADLYIKGQQAKIDELKDKLKSKEGAQLYRCPVCEIIFPFEEASENLFKCPSCSGALEFQDQDEIIKGIQSKIRELKTSLKEVS